MMMCVCVRALLPLLLLFLYLCFLPLLTLRPFTVEQSISHRLRVAKVHISLTT